MLALGNQAPFRNLSCIGSLNMEILLACRIKISTHQVIVDAMKNLSAIIVRNSGLHSFFLTFIPPGLSSRPDPCVNCTQCNSPPLLLPGSFKGLKRLHLAGSIMFNSTAWTNWDRQVDWTRLYCLELVGIKLIAEVLDHLKLALPSLRILRLRAYRGDPAVVEPLPFVSTESWSVIRSFLQAVPLEELDLSYFVRDMSFKDMIDGSGKKLIRLRLYLEIKIWVEPRPPVVFHRETAFLNTVELGYLNTTCPFLERLGMCIETQKDQVIVSRYLFIIK